ncbi:probable protein arginine N-methyltransferase 3 [Tanacetum coccineum]
MKFTRASFNFIRFGKASSMVAAALGPKPGWEVIDACAAPGNKTVHLAALMKGQGKVVACELNKDRVKRLEQTTKLAGATSILIFACASYVEVLHENFLNLNPEDQLYSKVRAILLDPSCSGSGTVADRLDHLLPSHTSGEGDGSDVGRLNKLAAFQEKALTHALSYKVAKWVVPAVERVVYSTCSIHQIENEDVIKSVLPLAASHGFQLATPFPQWPRRGLPVVEGSQHLLRTDPVEDKEGFFIALFTRNTNQFPESPQKVQTTDDSLDNLTHEAVERLTPKTQNPKFNFFPASIFTTPSNSTPSDVITLNPPVITVFFKTMVGPVFKNLGENGEKLNKVEDMCDVEEEDEEEEQNWDDWTGDGEEGEDEDLEMLCLFCDDKFKSSGLLFEHCRARHCFDFGGVRKALGLDFYGCFKLINYVRSQVAKNQCWNCGWTCESREELQAHLHEPTSLSNSKLMWDNDMYLKPYMENDHLLFSFDEDVDDDEDMVENLETMSIDDKMDLETYASNFELLKSCKENEVASVSENNGASSSNGAKVKSCNAETGGAYDKMSNEKKPITFSVNVDRDIMIVNKDYFGSYSSFGIHKEMISDKVRTDAYRQAIVGNPSLLKGAVVLDVGCGTGILSLFAAQAGASTVNAVEASEKMASVASQIAKDNGLLWNQASNGSGVVKVMNSMVEDLIESGQIEPHSVDVLVSEWMGYCLLYETMLSSVLVARDHWLKPGGAMLPDTATMFVAGFGKGATSVPFWENVYGFNMSSIGKELVEDAAHLPIVDVVDADNLVTNTAFLQTFDLVTMKHDEVDFTATVQLEHKSTNSSELESTTTKCYGVVIWFDTSFTSRFCKESPTVLSTSPYTPPTHWSQTLLTFTEPISLTSKMLANKSSSMVGSEVNPAVKIDSRISIARGVEHRSIDISLEVIAIGFDGQKRKWPVQMFNMR